MDAVVTLKDKLDIEWNRRGVRFPSHLCRWRLTKYSKHISCDYGFVSEETSLIYSQGKKSSPVRKSKCRLNK